MTALAHIGQHRTMTVQLVTTLDELRELETTWNELSGESPFRSWDWLATWWKHYGDGRRRKRDDRNGNATVARSERQLYVLAVYESADLKQDNESKPRLIGIAPWFLDCTVVKGNVLRWLGCGEVCTDHLSLICRPEDRETVAERVAEALTAQFDDWDRLDLGATDADDYSVLALVDHLEERECIVSRQVADSCWVLELPTSWDDYLAAVSKSHRKQLRQSERRVIESDRVKWNPVASAREFDEAWPILVDLHQRRRLSLGEPGCFASQAFHDFHHEVARRMLDRGQLRLSWLALDDTPAAAEYHFADSHLTYAYQGGVDPERLDEEPGRLSTILCLQRAMQEGHKGLDFLRGDEPYKAHWRAEPRTTYDYRVVPNRRLARLRGRVLTFTGAVTDWVRASVQQGQ
jgi:CelD/BcsL family acetyltransferase involved in cellulose biosynthesis